MAATDKYRAETSLTLLSALVENPGLLRHLVNCHVVVVVIVIIIIIINNIIIIPIWSLLSRYRVLLVVREASASSRTSCPNLPSLEPPGHHLDSGCRN